MPIVLWSVEKTYLREKPELFVPVLVAVIGACCGRIRVVPCVAPIDSVPSLVERIRSNMLLASARSPGRLELLLAAAGRG